MMEESDADFTPTPNTSSNLASLFDFTKQPLQGNPSLTYTAPKAPKSPAKKPSGQKSKAIISFSKVVQAYKLEDGNYVNQGVTGIVISSSHESHIYEIILYKPSKEYLSKITISNSFSVRLSPNNYASFYDKKNQNWSVLFSSSTDVEQFAMKLAICKFYSTLVATNIVIQDLTPLSKPQADEQSTVQITYCSFALNQEEMVKIKEDIKGSLKISNCKFIPLQKGLVGCCENSKRVIIIPYSLSAHWSPEIKSNNNLLLEVTVEKVLSDSEIGLECTSLGPRLSEDGRESQKANLISRMARMGQISLPLKQNLLTGPSDSEEESSIMTTSPKPRVARSRTAATSQSHPMQRPEPSHLVPVYQNDVAYHSGINKTGVAYQQLIPVSASPIPSPSVDPNLAVESRIQAAELRMGMSRISEKLDLVWNKIQNISKEPAMSNKAALLDSGGILTSIQSLITENESLKTKMEEQKEKIEQQNNKIFQLFELNHKLLEQSTTSHDKQSLSESKLKAEVESLRLKEIEIKAENKEALEKIKVLEGNLIKAEGTNKALNKELEELVEKIEQVKKNPQDEEKTKELENLKEELSKAWEVKTKFKDKLRAAVAEKVRLNSVIEVQKEEIESGNQELRDSKMKKEEYERTVEELKKQFSEEKQKTESRLESFSKDVTRLEEENKNLKKEIEKRGHQNDIKLKEVLSLVKKKFSDSKEYSSSEILTTIEKIFSDVTGGTLKPENKQKEFSKETPVVPAPRTSFLNAGKEEKSGVLEVKPAEQETKEETENEKKEIDSRHISYDQSWRTTKPPPLPLFDDDEDGEDDDWFN